MIDRHTVTYSNYAALVLRLTLGTMFIAHGLLKVLVFTVPGTVQFFESQGFPGFSAYAVIGAELLGGAALILGWQVRRIAAALIPVLLGATFVHWPNGWLFTAAGGGWEYPLFMTFTAVVQVLLGHGAYALDNLRSPATPAMQRA
jgi:putative oxidoreductase